MSRRRRANSDVHLVNFVIKWQCPRCRTILGLVVRRPTAPPSQQEMWSPELHYVEIPGKSAKLETACPRCKNEGRPYTPRVRVERFAVMLDEMVAAEEHERTFLGG